VFEKIIKNLAFVIATTSALILGLNTFGLFIQTKLSDVLTDCDDGCITESVTFACGARPNNVAFSLGNGDLAFFSNAQVVQNRDTGSAIFFGGSTTEGCHYWGEAFPKYLSKLLKVDGYNFGQVGADSDATMAFINGLLSPESSSINYVIIHDGYNDLPALLKAEGENYLVLEKSDKYIPNIWSSSNIEERGFVESYINLSGVKAIASWIKHGHMYTDGPLIKTDFYMGATDPQAITLTSAEFANLVEFQEQRFINNTIKNVNMALQKFVNAKVVLIINPAIIPYHHPHHPTGFRDPTVGTIFKKIHSAQQKNSKAIFTETFKDNNRVIIADLFDFSSDVRLFYDEFHLNDIGNEALASELANIIGKQ
jgi:hypothetical protein